MGKEDDEVEVGSVLGRSKRKIKPTKRFGEDVETGDELQQMEDDGTTPKKRGRGRPRKNPIEMVVVKSEKEDDHTQSNPEPKRVSQDLDYLKDTIESLPSSAVLSLLEPIFQRLSAKHQVKKLDDLLKLHVGMYRDSTAKQVPEDFMKASLAAMEIMAQERVDNVPYYFNQALASNLLTVNSASFAIVHVIVMSLFSNRLENFFSLPQATVFSDWLQTGCAMFQASNFLDHVNSVLFPLTNMQFEQTTTSDSSDLQIVLQIRAQVEEAPPAPASPAEEEEAIVMDIQAIQPETLQVINASGTLQGGIFTDDTGAEIEAVGILNSETGVIEPLEQGEEEEEGEEDDENSQNVGSMTRAAMKERMKERKRRRPTLPGEVPLKDGKAHCEECEISFRENRNYFKHMEQHDGKKSNGCPFCERRFDLRRVAFNHVLESHCRKEEGDEGEGEGEEGMKSEGGGASTEEGFVCRWCNLESPTMSDTFRNHIRHHMTMKIQCEFCNRDFHAKTYLKEHIELQHKGPPYICTQCEDCFTTKEAYKKHMKTNHKPGLVCKVCNIQFKNRREQQEHFADHTPEDLVAAGIKSKVVLDVIKDVLEQEKELKKQEKAQKEEILKEQAMEVGLVRSESSSPQKRTLTRNTSEAQIDMSDPTCRLRAKPHNCEYCGKGFTKPEVLKRHIARHLGTDVEYKCRFCDQLLKSQKEAKQHELDAHCKQPDGTYKCQWCEKSFMHPVKLRSHEWLHTKEPQYQCQYCAHKCKSKSILIRHENTHVGHKPYECPHCDKSFSLKHTLNEHILTHTGEKPFACEYCEDRRFISKAQLKSHMIRIHQGMEKNFGCEVCGKAFTTKASLQIHVRIHTGERPYPCKVCGKSFTNMTAMKRHAMVMHSAGDGPHICPYCNKEFAYKYSLYYHRKLVHETKPTLKCSYCEKKFRRKQEVQLHELVHTGVKDFKCKECGKQFRTKSQLLEHAIIHRGIPRFQCQSCDKAFIHRSSFKRHVLLHEGLVPYQCPHCDKAFPDRSNMLSHVRHIHKDEASDPSMIPTPKVHHVPARLPPELRKYPKPRTFEATGVEGNQIEYEIIKPDTMQMNEQETTEISNEALQTLLANSGTGEEQVSYMLSENGECIQVLNYQNADAAAAMNIMSVEGETYNMEIQENEMVLKQEGEDSVDTQLLNEEQMGDGAEGGSMVTLETAEGKQLVFIPAGTQFLQFGDQILNVGGGELRDSSEVLQVQGGEMADQMLQIEGGEGMGEHIIGEQVMHIEGSGDME